LQTGRHKSWKESGGWGVLTGERPSDP